MGQWWERHTALIVLSAVAIWMTARPAAANSTYLCVLAEAPEQLKDVDATIAACTETINSGPLRGLHLGSAYFHRAMMYSVKGDLQDALKDDSRALELSPNDSLVLANRGGIKFGLGDQAGAIADYTAAINATPRFAFAYYLRGTVYEHQEKWDDALADYRRALAEEAGLVQALAAGCRVHAIRNESLDDANRMCERAAHFTVNTFDVFFSRSLLRLRRNQIAGALADAQTAVQLQPSNPNAMFVKALCEERLGRADDAAADAKKAEALYPPVRALFVRWGFDTKLQ